VEVPLIFEPTPGSTQIPAPGIHGTLTKNRKNYLTYIKEEIINFNFTQERTNACHCTISYYLTTSIM
jgi:hypothetical protein